MSSVTSRKNRVMDAALPLDARLRFTELSTEALVERLSEVLAAKVHGLCFSGYLDGQGPDLKTQLTRAQLRDRMALLQGSTHWVRTFSCTDGNELSPSVARELGFKTLVGAWLGDDRQTNERELRALVQLAEAGQVDVAAVGNEVLLREDLSEDELLEAIAKVKGALPNTPVGYVDAYYLFTQHPRLVDACDVLLINCYPFWEECSVEHALAYMKEMVERVRRVAKGKRIIITETGWPSDGTAVGDGVPSVRNALLYALNTFAWTQEEGLELFYFSAFDETWKAGPEGGCGPHWGFWDKEGRAKYGRK